MKLIPSDRKYLKKFLDIRNNNLQNLRTPYYITEGMQNEYWNRVIDSRQENSRIFMIEKIGKNKVFADLHPVLSKDIIGFGGIENIEWENSRAEYSIIVEDKKYLEDCVKLLTDYAFYNLNLKNIWGELYNCNTMYDRWIDILNKYQAYKVDIKYLKYYDGKYYDGLWYNINCEDYKGTVNG